MTLPRAAVVLLLATNLGGCGCSPSPAPGGASCASGAECSAGEACIDGACVPREVAGRDAATDGADAGACRDITDESTLEPAPVDIIVTIDNSGSMTAEAMQTRDNLNRFADIIAASGLDYRVVLISRPGESDNGVCVPPPLGTGMPGCVGGADGRLLAVHQPVSSRNAPRLVLELYPMYQDFLRIEAVKVFVWITDDESGLHTADSFRAELAALEPDGMFQHTIHNAIVGHYGDTPETWAAPSAGDCGSLAHVGTTYLRLASCLADDDTAIADCAPGRTARVCEPVWTAIFEEIAMGVVAGVPVACEFDLPEAPMGMMLDLDAIDLTYSAADGTTLELERTSADACTDRGWHLDDESAPTRIELCPELCAAVQAREGSRIHIALGCYPIFG